VIKNSEALFNLTLVGIPLPIAGIVVGGIAAVTMH
jgi:hypothetical protein